VEQTVLKETAIWVEAIKMFGYIVGAFIPAYFSYRVIVKRMPFRKRGADVDTTE